MGKIVRLKPHGALRREATALRTYALLSTPSQSVAALGYPAAQVRRATIWAQAVLRALRIAPCPPDVAQALHRESWTTTAAAPEAQHPADDDRVVVVLVRDGPDPPSSCPGAAAWPPPGDGIRYLATGDHTHPHQTP